jgi:tetratricopeptide (TPR) repeat protein
MDILNQIVLNLNKEDLRFYKLFSSRHDMGAERKDLVLLDYIRDSEELYDDELIFKKIYGKRDKNALYSLKNRLMHDISRSLTVQYCYKDELLYVHHLLFLVRLFFMRNQFTVSQHFLKKAETEAKKIENYELLDIIFGEYIKLSHELLDINPEEYILKREEARKLSASILEVDNVLAAVYYRLKTSQNFSETGNPLLKMLEKTVDTFSLDKSVKKSPKLRFKIYSAVTQILLQRHEYETLEKYLLKTYKEFLADELFNKENHSVKLQMLHYMVNVIFKNKKYEDSLIYAETFNEAMKEYDKLLYDKFVFFYYNSLVINYSVLDKDKAISVLEEVLEHKTLKNTPFYELFVYLNLAILWFEKKDFRVSVKFLNKLYLHPEFKNADPGLKFKISIAELIIRFELLDFDYLEVKLKQVKRQFKALLTDPANAREKGFLSILTKMTVSPQIRSNKPLMATIQKFISSKEEALNDTEVIDYSGWLRGKTKV